MLSVFNIFSSILARGKFLEKTIQIQSIFFFPEIQKINYVPFFNISVYKIKITNLQISSWNIWEIGIKFSLV